MELSKEEQILLIKLEENKDTYVRLNCIQVDVLTSIISNLQEENKKQGKVIDMMSLSISSLDGQLEINQYKDKNDVKHKFFEYLEDGTYEGLKQYFYRKVEEDD